MANRVMPQTEASHRLQMQLFEAVREIRVARLTSGLRLVDVAPRAGLSVSRLSELERGLAPAVELRQLARLGTAVGLRMWIRFFPLERHVLDAGQVALLERFHARIAPAWRWETEVPMPTRGDLRAVDARLIGPVSIAVEAVTRLVDFQAQVRAANLKRRDLAADRLLLLLGGSGANRRAVQSVGELATVTFPVSTRPALAALAEGRDPGGDCLVLL